MELKGERLIKADRATVFAALNDVEVLKRAIPGCKSLEREGENELTATVQAKVGPVKATFKGKVTLSNIVEPEGYTITGEGKGGAAGFAKGGADVKLTETPDGTLLEYEVNADVGGKLAQIGARLIDGTARKLSGEFFDAFAAELEPAEAPESDVAAEPAAAQETVEVAAQTAAPSPTSSEPKGNDAMMYVVLGAGVALGLVYAAFIG